MATETPGEFVKRVREYEAKATKGPWYIVEEPWRASYYDKERGEHVLCTTFVVAGTPDPHGGKAVLSGVEIEEWESDRQRDEAIYQSDCELEFAANSRTDLPAACDFIEAQSRDIESMQYEMDVARRNSDALRVERDALKAEIERLKAIIRQSARDHQTIGEGRDNGALTP